jgi:8-oxo-dGTP diphosphatase
MNKYVVGFIFLPDKSRIVLIEKKRPAWQAGLYNGIGGHIDENEEPIDAIIREVNEEAGIETREEDWNCFAVGTEIESGDIIYFFSCFNEIYKHAYTAGDEVIVLIEIKYLFQNKYLIPNLNWLIPLALDEQNCMAKFNFMLNTKCNSNE